MWVNPFDGTDWSALDSFNFTTLPNPAPAAFIADHVLHVNKWSRVASWPSYSDADSNAARFWDSGAADKSVYF